MCRYTSFFIVILLFSCNTSKKIKKDNQLINESSLTEIEAIKIKDKTYRNYRENLLVDRLNEMEKRTININNREMKFDLKFSLAFVVNSKLFFKPGARDNEVFAPRPFFIWI